MAKIVRGEGGVEVQGSNGRFHNPLYRPGCQPFAVGAFGQIGSNRFPSVIQEVNGTGAATFARNQDVFRLTIGHVLPVQ